MQKTEVRPPAKIPYIIALSKNEFLFIRIGVLIYPHIFHPKYDYILYKDYKEQWLIQMENKLIRLLIVLILEYLSDEFKNPIAHNGILWIVNEYNLWV